MRPWIEHLFSSTAAYADFLAYTSEIDNELTSRIQKALIGDNAERKIDTELATRLAMELDLWRKIRNKFQKETKEHLSQVSHQAKIKGR